ncbi:MAG: cytochrome c [Planctomycetota bacterium]
MLKNLDLRLFLPQPPLWLIAAAVLLLVASWVPLALFLKHRFSWHEEPRIHLWQDMDNQPKLKAQGTTPVFADGRAMRPHAAGTIARGHLDTDDHLHRGFVLAAGDGGQLETVYLEGIPGEFEVDEEFVAHGQLKYNAQCYPCHGFDGRGNGPVNQRGAALQANANAGVKLGTAWVPVTNLLQEAEPGQLQFGPGLYPDGKLYNTIVNGKGNMVGQGHALSLEDRWAIVAYVRALQLAQRPDAVQAAWGQQDRPGPAALADRDQP